MRLNAAAGAIDFDDVVAVSTIVLLSLKEFRPIWRSANRVGAVNEMRLHHCHQQTGGKGLLHDCFVPGLRTDIPCNCHSPGHGGIVLSEFECLKQ